ncbi:Gfo/Idh/MocA family oxidoreductase [Candidatus Bathyarchaeota archaeon]|nr:Gfo/Idh/MocA family oxidoreductase [Candidatus Bathyarchaeota archaeon]
MKDVRAGVIGVGFIGPAHVEALRRLGVEVVALSSSSEERAKVKAKEMQIPKAYGDYRMLIEDEDVDVVHVCSPNNLHYVMVKEALAIDKHVVCEKPLAMNSKETGELVKLSSMSKKVHAVCYNIRFYPLCLEVREMIRQGELGEIYFVNGFYLQDWLFFDTDWNWRVTSEAGGDLRAVADIGTHWMDLVCFVTGLKINRVNADLKTFIPVRKRPKVIVETFKGKELKPADYVEYSVETEDYASVFLDFSGGVRGTLTVSQVAAGKKNDLRFEIYGSKKAVAWSSESPNELWIGYRDKPNELVVKDPSLLRGKAKEHSSYPGGHTEGYPDTFKQLFKCIYTAVEEGNKGQPLYPTFMDGHDEVLVCEAIKRSAQEGCWVNVKH